MINSNLSVLILSLFIGLLTACDDSEDSDSSASSNIQTKWNNLCVASSNVEASNCPENADTSALVLFCQSLSIALIDNDTCQTKLDEYTECNATREWTCMEGGEVPFPVEPDPCADLAAAFTISLGEGSESGECMDSSQL